MLRGHRGRALTAYGNANGQRGTGPRSRRCCRRRPCESTTHLYSLQMARVSRIMQLCRLLFIHLISFLKPRCRLKQTHGTSSLQWDIIYSAAVSITNAPHSAITHREQCRNSLQFEPVGNNPPPPRTCRPPACLSTHGSIYFVLLRTFKHVVRPPPTTAPTVSCPTG